ncbi:hypothetical protein [Vibrio rarus]|uniref:hypothetical protein n=1 Tax=Vibrio rarus TaxID=413403 RepID=UPI0021C2CD12|nr:hypothetical protein [Vibrio rarus]
MTFILSSLGIYLIHYLIQASRLKTPIIFCTGLIGVTVHELSHYLMAKVCGFHVTEVRLFQMPTRTNPTMGYVAFTRPNSIFGAVGHVLVSVAPLILGSLCLALSSNLSFINQLTHTIQHQSIINYPTAIYSLIQQATIIDLVVLFALASITLHMLPSSTDIKGALKGSLYVGCLVYFLMLAGVLYMTHIESFIMHWAAWLGAVMSFGLLAALPIAGLAMITRR